MKKIFFYQSVVAFLVFLIYLRMGSYGGGSVAWEPIVMLQILVLNFIFQIVFYYLLDKIKLYFSFNLFPFIFIIFYGLSIYIITGNNFLTNLNNRDDFIRYINMGYIISLLMSVFSSILLAKTILPPKR